MVIRVAIKTDRTPTNSMSFLAVVFKVCTALILIFSVAASVRVSVVQSQNVKTMMETMDASTFPVQQRKLYPAYSDFHPLRNEDSTCDEGLNFVRDRIHTKQSSKVRHDNRESQDSSKTPKSRRIPRLIHQTSKTRCLGEQFFNATNRWKDLGEDWEYLFYDDDDIDRVLRFDFPEFPHLSIIANHCIVSGTAKADLFRYVILYLYGGVYADIDSAPHIFNDTTIQHHDDGFFVVEQYHLLSQYFMAVSPRHPLMYYAIQHSLLNLMTKKDTGQQNAAYVTGPHALHAAYRDFRLDNGEKVDPAGTGYKPVWSGKFVGTEKRSVTVVGRGENENEYVWRSLVKQYFKVREYAQQGMEHFSVFTKGDRSTGISCLTAIYTAMKTT